MEKVFLDFGSNKFQGLVEIYKKLNMDSSWEIHSYEPNKLLLDWSRENKHIIEKKIGNNINQHPAGVWNKNTTTTFSATPSIDDDWNEAGYINDVGEKFKKSRPNVQACSDTQTVNLIDVCDILKPHLDKYIVIKMDIESSEFDVIDRIFECKLEKHIDVLFVEYHCRFFEDRDFYRKKQNEQVEKLSKHTDVTIWH